MWELLVAQCSLHIRWISLHVFILSSPRLSSSDPEMGTQGLLLGKPSMPGLHPEFLGTLAFSEVCLPSYVRKHGTGECLGLRNHEMYV